MAKFDAQGNPYAFTSPADGWLFALYLQGIGLFVVSAILERLDLAALGFAYLVTGFFFAAALPTSDAKVHEGAGARLALGFLRLLPRPRIWVRALALAALLAPGLGTRVSDWLIGLMVVLFADMVLRTPDARSDASLADLISPVVMTGVVAAYALLAGASVDAEPARALAGLAWGWLAQALFLRRAAARQWAAVAIIAQKERGVPLVQVPLDDYVSEMEKLTAEAPSPAASADGAVLVGSGGFRVDAAKMIEKLSERQLADAEDFILAWLRAGVASGAKGQLALEWGWRSLRLRFDGKPFPESLLKDPYRSLLDPEADDAVRGAQLAYGLLAVLRLKPESIWIVSGEGAARARMMFAVRAGGSEEPPADPGSGTLISVRFGGPAGPLRPYLACRRASRGFGLAPVGLSVNGHARRTAFATVDGWSRAAQEGWTFAFKLRSGEVSSRVRVYYLGTLIEELEQPTELRDELDAAITHDQLRLSISQSSVVRDERFAEGLRFLQSAAVTARVSELER